MKPAVLALATACMVSAPMVADATARGDGAARPAAGSTAPVELGFDATANLGFANDVTRLLQRMAADERNQLCLQLPATSANAGPPPATRKPPPDCGVLRSPVPAATVHIVMLRNGAIWRIASSFEPGIDRPLGLGSLAKAVLALPLLALDDGHVEEQWCESPIETAGGGEASAPAPATAECPPGARIGARAAFAASRNGALIDRLRRIPADRIRDHLVTAQMRGGAALRHPAVAVPLGLIELTPRQALECFDALASGQARRAAFLRNPLAEATLMSRWCADVVSSPRRLAYVHAMLRAPGEADGTASFAVQALPTALRGGPVPLAKTGTPSDAERQDLGKTLLMSFLVGAHRYTALLAVVSPRPDAPLARRLPADFLLPLVRLVGQHAQP